MTTPAIRQVQTAFKALAEAALPDWTVAIDRSDDEPFSFDERPALAIRVPSVQLDTAPELGGGMTRCRAAFELDFHSSQTSGETIDEANQRGIALLIAAIGADRTLGGRCENVEEQAISGSELDGATVGCAILSVDVTFYTPRGDLFTIVGVGGQRFT